METKEIAVTCPCCDSRINVDVRTRKILSWRRAEELGNDGKPVVTEEDWTKANEDVAGRMQRSEDAFDAGLSREKKRSRDLDDLWKKIQEEED